MACEPQRYPYLSVYNIGCDLQKPNRNIKVQLKVVVKQYTEKHTKGISYAS